MTKKREMEDERKVRGENNSETQTNTKNEKEEQTIERNKLNTKKKKQTVIKRLVSSESGKIDVGVYFVGRRLRNGALQEEFLGDFRDSGMKITFCAFWGQITLGSRLSSG